VKTGTIYLLHFDEPYQHARHYLGWTQNLDLRLFDHAGGRGARLLAVVRSAGINWRLARIWEGTRARERQIKRQGGLSRSCPMCGVRPGSTAGRKLLASLAQLYPAYTGGPPS